MEIKVYAIKDCKVGAFMQPFYLANDEVAKRAFSYSVNTPGSDIYIYWQDLQLFKLGEYNDVTGEIKSNIEYLAQGADFKKENINGDSKPVQPQENDSNAEV